MKTVYLILALAVIVSCAKLPVDRAKTFEGMSPEEEFHTFISPRLFGEIDDNRCPIKVENLDSLLIADEYFLWIEIDNGVGTYHEQGEVSQVRANSALLRCGLFGYGRAWMRLDTWEVSSAKKVGVTHWPIGSVSGMNIIEVYHHGTDKTWILRSNTEVGEFLAFTSAINGYANEGSQTGSATAYLRTPDLEYFIATEDIVTGFTLTLYDGEGAYFVNQNSYTEYGRILWRNFQTENSGWDYFQPCSVQNMMIRVDLTVEGASVQSNWYSFNMRSQYQSDNACQGSNDYLFTSNDPLIGEFKYY